MDGTYVVALGGKSSRFTLSGGVFVSTEGDGAALALASGTYTYTARDGTRAVFASNAGYAPTFAADDVARLSSITFPDGAGRKFTWVDRRACEGTYVIDAEFPNGYCTEQVRTVVRLQSVENNLGHMLLIKYELDVDKKGASFPADMDPDQLQEWSRIEDVTALNTRVQACDPVVHCIPLASWPKATYAADGSAKDTLGRSIRSYVSPIFGGDGRVASATRDGVTFAYVYQDAAGIRTTTRTDPNGKLRRFESDIAASTLKKVTDEAGHATTYAHDTAGRVTEISYPEGNKVQFSYDARGNVLTTRRIAKAGWGQADIVTSATYPATCANPETCNQPLTTTDARGHVTDYDYDPTHGGVVRVTLPAPAAGAARPETRYGYSLLSGQYLLTRVSACSTGAAPACLGTANEVRTTIAYASAGAPDNFLPVSITAGAGDGSLAATTAIAYDALGNATHVDGPLPGPADTTRTFYDTVGQVTGVIGPDPDGAGAMKHRARRFTYNADGIVTKVEEGTAGGQSEGDLATMTVLRQVDSAIDTNRRKTRDTASAGGTTYAATDYAYDALGRPLCTAVRMNLQALGQPACARNPDGAYGPDRITRTTYTNRGEVAQVETGHGTADAIAETASYQPNGGIAFVVDGKGNTSFIAQDGHDRIFATYYPSPAAPGTVNWSDYENVYFDLAGNVVHRRLRDGQVITYGHDALDRVTSKDLPNNATFEGDASYTYDNLGRLTGFSDTIGHVQTLGYDALGRLTTDASNWYGTVSHQYDLAGRRTRLTWPDQYFVTYARQVTGEVSAIRQYGSELLASFGYDAEGRRTSLARANGTVTSYAHDALGRLTSQTENMAGTAGDHVVTLAYNPAGQIATRTGSNPAYAWTGHGSGTTNTSVDGRNFLTSVGGVAATQDAKGNLLSNQSGGSSAPVFSYTAENRLASGPGSNLYYDPLGRLRHVSGSGTDFVYDGNQVLQELGAYGAGHRRFWVPGPNPDERILWVEGTSERRWLHSDERGSVVAVSDNAGNLMAVNRYDEYGRSQTTAAGSGQLFGRFGYTGQAWLPEIGVYYYKARMYDPHGAGRFLQSDRLGYVDGLNMWAYVGGDPINLRDPAGLAASNNNDDRDNVMPNDPRTDDSGTGESDGSDIIVEGRQVAEAVANVGAYTIQTVNYVSSLPSYVLNVAGYAGKKVILTATSEKQPRRPKPPKVPKYKKETLETRENRVKEYYDRLRSEGLGNRYNAKDQRSGFFSDLMKALFGISEAP